MAPVPEWKPSPLAEAELRAENEWCQISYLCIPMGNMMVDLVIYGYYIYI